jgi:benzoyl-CoA reductase subunit C
MMTNTFKEAYDQRHRIGRGYRENGKRLFGYMSNYVPEEIIHAAGIIPVRVRGGGQGLKKAAKYLPPNICSYLRGCLDEGLMESYDYLDGFVSARSCDAIRNFFSIWVRLLKPDFSFYLAVPTKNTRAAIDYFVEELNAFKISLEGYLGKPISEDALRHSMDIYNENRGYLARLQQMRLDGTIDLPGSLFHSMVMAGLVMPKEEHNRLLKSFMDTVPSTTSTASISTARGIPMALIGNTFEDISLLNIVEKHGGNVLIEDTSLGRPYYMDNVNNHADPLNAIAERYLGKTVEPYQCNPHRRIDQLIQDVKAHRIQGVINVVQKYCDEYLIENVPLKEELLQHNIPHLFLDMDDTVATSKQIETRIQAFMEMLKGLPGEGC